VYLSIMIHDTLLNRWNRTQNNNSATQINTSKTEKSNLTKIVTKPEVNQKFRINKAFLASSMTPVVKSSLENSVYRKTKCQLGLALTVY